jgi:hypothetical protein
VVIGSDIAAGDLLIREFRLRGTAGAEDEYVEVFNKSLSPLTIASTDGSTGFGVVSETAGLLATILNGTVIPRGGSFLAANSNGYSLSAYGGPGAATYDDDWTVDLPDNSGVGVFRSTSSFDMTTRLDAAGFTSSAALYREGAGLTPSAGIGADGEWVFMRKAPYPSGAVKDTGDNAADFQFQSTNAGIYSTVQSMLGAPGPQNLAAPTRVILSVVNADPGVGSDVAPNRVQIGNNHYFRRKVTNNTGSTITKLKVRIADVATLFSPGYGLGGQADGRGVGTSDVIISLSDTTTRTAKGLTLEAPSIAFSATGKGAGYNASFEVNVGAGLAAGDSIYVNIGFRSVKGGTFFFLLVPEVLN